MLERFTEKSIKVLVLAQKESSRAGHLAVGAQQLLLGLLCENGCTAGEALNSFGIDLKIVREKMQPINECGDDFPKVELPFTSDAKRVFDLAWSAATETKRHRIGTGHLLIGIIDDTGGHAADFLVKIGVDLKELRRDVVARILNPATNEEREPKWEQMRACQRAAFSFLGNIGNRLVYASQVENELRAILKSIFAVMQISRLVLVLTDSDATAWKTYECVHDDLSGRDWQDWSAVKSPIVAQVLQAEQPVQFSDFDDDFDIREELRKIGVKSALGIAIRHNGVNKGCLIIQECTGSREWKDDEFTLTLLHGVVGPLAVALARLEAIRR